VFAVIEFDATLEVGQRGRICGGQAPEFGTAGHLIADHFHERRVVPLDNAKEGRDVAAEIIMTSTLVKTFSDQVASPTSIRKEYRNVY